MKTTETEFVKCNHCDSVFRREYIKYDDEADDDRCPVCNRTGAIMWVEEEDK